MLTAVKEAGKLFYSRQNVRSRGEAVRVPELCRQKLLHYAESFEELARCMDITEEEQTTESDRSDVIEARRVVESRMMIRHNLYEMSQIMVQLADELMQCRPMEERYQ